MYSSRDLEALEQIVVLKFIGIPLEDSPFLGSMTRPPGRESFVEKPVWDFMTRVLARRV